MDKSEKEIHEGTEYLQHLAEEVERERKERGRATHDVTIDPDDEEPKGHNLTEPDLHGTDKDVAEAGPTPGGYARIRTQDSPQ